MPKVRRKAGNCKGMIERDGMCVGLSPFNGGIEWY